MASKKKHDKVVFASYAGDKKIVSLIEDGDDRSYDVMVTHCGKESRRSVIVAFGIADLDDARLIFDRQSKIIFDEAHNEMKGM